MFQHDDGNKLLTGTFQNPLEDGALKSSFFNKKLRTGQFDE